MSDAERAHLLGLCDAIVGTPSLRDHRFEWLRDDDGTPVAVDAWWEARSLVVIVFDDAPPPSFRRDARVCELHGQTVVALTVADVPDLAALLEPDSSAQVQRRIQTGVLDAPQQTASFGAYFDDEDEGAQWDDELAPWERDADPAPPEPPAIRAGWRANAMLLAALGAGALHRRAFGEDVGLELLCALAMAPGDAGASTADLLAATGFAAYDGWAHEALLALAREGELESVASPDEEFPRYLLTEAGAERVARFLRRAAPLFGAWPRSPEAADDAS